LEWCADPKRLGAKTLFATHYHELTCLEEQLPAVQNFNIAAKKRDDRIIFLRKILPGKADQSYGVEVAKLAGVPERVVLRSRALLKELEAQGAMPQVAASIPQMEEQLSLAHGEEAEVLCRLRETAVEALTPLEAINLLYELKQKL
jgi:DNA mismatch repair protein MutS